MSTPAAAPPTTETAIAAAAAAGTSPAGPSSSANELAPAVASDSPATFLTAPTDLTEHDARPPTDDIMASLGAPIGGVSSDGGASVPAEKASAGRPAGDQSSTPLSANDLARADASKQGVRESTPATTAAPTATTSTSTADVKPTEPAGATRSSPGPAAAAAAAPSSSTQPANLRQSPSTAGRPAPPTKKKKKGGLAGFLAAVFPCFPSDDGAYDPASGAKKPAARTPSAGPTGATPAGSSTPTASEKVAPAVAKASKTSTLASSEKLPAGGEPLRQITSRELMAVDTAPVAAAATARDKTPKPTPIALPVPTTPLTTKRSTGSLHAAGGDVVIPPPTPTSPPIDETAGLTSAAVVPPGSGSLIHPHTHPSQASSHAPTPTATTPQLAATTDGAPGSPDESFSATDSEVSGSDAGGQRDRYEDSQAEGGELYRHHPDDEGEDEGEEEDEDAHLLGGVGIPIGPDGKECPLLPPMAAAHKGRKCLVLDLDETLLHSSFKLIPQADYIVPVEIESQTHNVYVIKRPGVDNFLKRMGEIYEVVIFTASLSKYADPVLDMLDVHRVVSHRLFRESCYNHKGNYVKDLSQLGRPIDETIIIDNSPASYIFHPNNAVPVSTWFNDPHDSELNDLILFLADLANVEDVRGVLDGGL